MPAALTHRLPERIRRPRLPGRTARLRLTALHGGLSLFCGVVLLGILYLLVAGAMSEGGTHRFARSTGPRPTRQAIAIAQAAELARKAQIAADLRQFLIQSGIALGIVAAVAVALGWLMAGRVLSPLSTITATARRISASNLNERLHLNGPDDELKDLGDTLDDLFERLEAAFEAQRRFVANASHELRTPLTMMRTALDVATCKPHLTGRDATILAAKMSIGLDRADRLLEGFLMLARAQNGPFADSTTLSLGPLASAAIAERSEAIAAMGLTVEQAHQDTIVQGSAILLTRMIDNVIDNAVRHNEPGGWIRVTTKADGPLSRLTVETGGQKLDDRQIRELAQPFRRLGPDRTGSDNGTGLGLSIVRAITATHHGTLDLHARAQGGLRVVIALPAGTPAAMAGRPA